MASGESDEEEGDEEEGDEEEVDEEEVDDEEGDEVVVGAPAAVEELARTSVGMMYEWAKFALA